MRKRCEFETYDKFLLVWHALKSNPLSPLWKRFPQKQLEIVHQALQTNPADVSPPVILLLAECFKSLHVKLSTETIRDKAGQLDIDDIYE